MDTRREFIKKAAMLSGAAGVFGVLPASIQKAFAIDPEPGTTWMDAEHVVILMQENRSFDHSYGTLQGVRGFNDPRAIRLPGGNPVWLQTNARGDTFPPFRLDIKGTNATWMGSLPHGWNDQVDARNQGKHDRWLHVKKSGHHAYADMPLTMGHYTRRDIPFYYALADAFTICDQHFCSSLTGTMPNRLYLWGGTIRGARGAKGPAKVFNSDVEYEDSANWRMFPELLEENNISWKVYQNELSSMPVGFSGGEDAWLSNYGDNPLEWFTQYHARFLPAHRAYLDQLIASLPAKITALKAKVDSLPATDPSTRELAGKLAKEEAELKRCQEQRAQWSPENFEKLTPREKSIFEKAFTTNTGDPAYHELASLTYRDGQADRELKVPKGDVFHQFRKDVADGKLPAVSWIVAPEAFSDHPSSAWYGAWYVSEALDILTGNPEVWKKTIFMLTYDENDGYFDHVPPFVAPHPHKPETGLTSPGAPADEDFVSMEEEAKLRAPESVRESSIGLGYRVPLVIASPWSRGGFVCSQVFDHTSVLQFLEKFASRKCGHPVEETNISPWRRAVCGDLTSSFRPYHGEKIKLPEFVAREPFVTGIHQAQYKNTPSGFRALTPEEIALVRRGLPISPPLARQEPGVRPSCALPYELKVNGKLDHEQKAFEITFAALRELFGARAAGSPFNVYAHGYGDTAAAVRMWSFAAAAGETISYRWPLADFAGGRYHLQVYGPNGFFREFKGSAEGPRLEVDCGQPRFGKADLDHVQLAVTNTSEDSVCKIEVTDNAYKSAARRVTVLNGNPVVIAMGDHSNSGWYDLTVRVPGNEFFEWRYAGRVETGSPGVTDPAMGMA